MTKELTQWQKETIEDVVRIMKLPPASQNNSRHIVRDRLAFLFQHQQKGNWAFNELEQVWGIFGDYTDHDFGNEIIN